MARRGDSDSVFCIRRMRIFDGGCDRPSSCGGANCDYIVDAACKFNSLIAFITKSGPVISVA